MSSILNIVLATTGGAAVLNALGGIQSVLGGIATAATSTTAALTGIQNALDFGGQLTDLSARTGQSVRDLVVLRRAFETSGIGAANTAPMVGLLQKAISGLNEEGGKTDGVFKRLGVSAESLKALSALDQVAVLTRAFEGIKEPSERAAMAMQLFGRSGAQMLQLLGDSSALSTAEREVGRLAVRAGQNAAKFDEIGDKLSVAKDRLQEFFVVAAEKAIPSLERMAKLLDALNPSVFGAVLGNFGMIAAALSGAKLLTALDTKIYDSLKTMKAGLVLNVTDGLARFTGFLTKILPIGLAAVIGSEVLEGIMNGYAEWKNQHLESANATLTGVQKNGNRAREIRSEQDRLNALAEVQAQIPAAEAALAAAQDRWFGRSEQEIGTYTTTLGILRNRVKMLTGEWAAHTLTLNRATDAAKAHAAGEMAAAEFLKSDAAEKMRDDIIAAERAALSARDRVDFTRTELALHDQSFAAERAKYDLEQDAFKLGQLDLKASALRLDILDRLTKAQAELNAEKQAGLAADLAKLDADFTRTDASKWEKRRELLDAAIEKQRIYVKEQSTLATTAEAKGDTLGAGIYTANTVKGAEGLADLNQQRASLGPDPNSWLQQSISALTQLQTEWGTTAEQIGTTIRGTIGGAVTTVSQGLTGWIIRAGDWRQKLLQGAQTIGVNVVQSIVQMGVSWVANLGVMAAKWLATKIGLMVAEKGIAAASTAALLPIAMAQSAIWAEPATLATIASFGGAAAQAPFSIAASVGATQALSAIPGFLDGDFTGGRRGKIAGFVHGEEFVFSAPAVDAIGVDNLRGAHEAALAGDSSAAASAIGGGAGAGVESSGLDLRAALNDFAGRITLIQVNSEVEATRIARRSRAAGDVVQIVRDNFPEIMKRGPRG